MAGDARRALLERLIDHAPMFPPASLPPEEAEAEDRRFRNGPFGWLVNRYVVPASKLGDVGNVSAPLSVVLDEAPASWPAEAQVEAVEASDTVLLSPFRAEVERFLEVGANADLEPLRAAGWHAKIRCGGASVPSIQELAGFVSRCRELSLPFKATAGLHHPLRTDGQHGFLNLAAAAVFGDEEEALADDDPAAFALDDDVFHWRGRSAGAEEVARVRRELFVAFGSCSAQEPADELIALGFLAG